MVYTVSMLFEDGTVAESDEQEIDTFNKGKRYIWFNYMERDCIRMTYIPKDIQIDFLHDITFIDPSKVKLYYTFEDFNEEDLSEEQRKAIENKKIVSITFTRMNKVDEYRYVL